MTEKEFKRLLENDTRERKYRKVILNTTYNNPQLISYLVNIMQQSELKYAPISARIVELVCKKDLKLLLPYIDSFCNSLNKIKENAVIRSSAKLIELICIELYIKYNPIFIEKTTESHLELFTENCFDWMISDKATAIQAHSMYALYLIGLNNDKDWVHEELMLNINKNLFKHSIGYQNRGKKIIKAIKTKKLFKL